MIIWHGGAALSPIGNLFLKKYINQNLEVIPDTRNHPFLEGIPIPVWERKHILNKATQLTRIFVFSPMCGQCQWQASFQILVQSEGNTMRLFSHSNQFFDAGPRQAGWELFGGERTVDKTKWWFWGITAFCWEDLVGFDNNLIHFAFFWN